MSTIDECLVSAAVELDRAAESMIAVHGLLWARGGELCDEALRLQVAVDALMKRVESELAGGGPRMVS